MKNINIIRNIPGLTQFPPHHHHLLLLIQALAPNLENIKVKKKKEIIGEERVVKKIVTETEKNLLVDRRVKIIVKNNWMRSIEILNLKNIRKGKKIKSFKVTINLIKINN